MIYLLQFIISFAAVFLKGFQHQNVIGGKYVPAFFVSYLMAIFDVAVVTFVVQNGWASVMPVGTGAALGIVSSMWLYRRWDKTKPKCNHLYYPVRDGDILVGQQCKLCNDYNSAYSLGLHAFKLDKEELYKYEHITPTDESSSSNNSGSE